MLVTPHEILGRRRRVLVECKSQGLSQEETGRRLLEVDPEYPPGFLALGTAKLADRDLDAAEPLLWRALAGAPTNPGYYLPLTALCGQRGETLLGQYLAVLTWWKTSFYSEIPEKLIGALASQLPMLGEAAKQPDVYLELAENAEKDLAGKAWPERLTPYRLLNEVQRQDVDGLTPELLAEIRANAAACAPLFEAAVREGFDSEISTLTVDAFALLLGLLGEIGGPELVGDLFTVPGEEGAETLFHAQWAVRRLGERYPEETFARLREIGKNADAELRATVAQHLYFLRERPGARAAILDLLEDFPKVAADEDGWYLLLTVSTLMAMMGASEDSLAVLRRWERQLPKEDRRLMKTALEAEEGFIPDLIDFGIDSATAEEVFCNRLLMEGDEDDAELDDDVDEEEFEEPVPVVKPGRNDACWCGSGKKYKKCHLQQDEEDARTQEAGDADDRFVGTVWRRLLDFSRQFHRSSEMNRALEMYFGRKPSTVDNETIAESGFLTWYVLDFRATPGGATIAEEFLRRRGAGLPERERAMIESWRDARYALWQVRNVEKGRGVELTNTLQEETFFVADVSTSRTARTGEHIAGHIQLFEDKWLFVGDSLRVPLPAVERIRAEVETGSRAAGLSPAGFFRARGHQWHRWIVEGYAESTPLPKIVNAEGDSMEFASAEYAAPDADSVAAALGRAAEFVETTIEGESANRTFAWLEAGDEEAPRRAYGHVELGAGKLRLECNSRRRLAEGRALIEKTCGSLVRHRADTFDSVEQAFKNGR
jgi:hypothetical protein